MIKKTIANKIIKSFKKIIKFNEKRDLFSQDTIVDQIADETKVDPEEIKRIINIHYLFKEEQK